MSATSARRKRGGGCKILPIYTSTLFLDCVSQKVWERVEEAFINGEKRVCYMLHFHKPFKGLLFYGFFFAV
jgi:hypothetical protein